MTISNPYAIPPEDIEAKKVVATAIKVGRPWVYNVEVENLCQALQNQGASPDLIVYVFEKNPGLGGWTLYGIGEVVPLEQLVTEAEGTGEPVGLTF